MVTPEEIEVSLRSVDWRHKTVTVMTSELPQRGPNMPAHKAGSAVRLASAFRYRGGPAFFFLSRLLRRSCFTFLTNPMLSGEL
jgi:hypothetical protein